MSDIRELREKAGRGTRRTVEERTAHALERIAFATEGLLIELSAVRTIMRRSERATTTLANSLMEEVEDDV